MSSWVDQWLEGNRKKPRASLLHQPKPITIILDIDDIGICELKVRNAQFSTAQFLDLIAHTGTAH